MNEIVMIGAIFIVMYFFMIKPQAKKQKDLKENEYVIFNTHCRLTKIAHLNQILRKLLQVIRLTRTTKIFFPCKID